MVSPTFGLLNVLHFVACQDDLFTLGLSALHLNVERLPLLGRAFRVVAALFRPYTLYIPLQFGEVVDGPAVQEGRTRPLAPARAASFRGIVDAGPGHPAARRLRSPRPCEHKTEGSLQGAC